MARQSSVAGIVSVLLMSVIGLLAGYGVLQLYWQRVAPVADTRPASPPPVVAPSPQPVRQQPVYQPPRPAVAQPPVARPVPQPTKQEPPPVVFDEQMPEPPPQREYPEPSATVTLTLDEPLIRVITEPEGVDLSAVYCDIAIDGHLGSIRADADMPRTEVVKGMRRGDAKDIVFFHSVKDVVIGVEAKAVVRGSSFVVELRPKFKLPSGYETQLTKTGGTRKARDLERDFIQANAAKDSIGDLLNQLQDVKSKYTSAARDASQASNTITGQQRAMRAAAEAQQLFRAGAAIERRIATAEAMKAAIPAIEKDGRAMAALEEYAATIAGKAQIFVRIYSEGITIPAEIR